MASAITSPAIRLPARRGGGETRADDELVSALRAGDGAAFEAIFDRYHRRILAFCRHMLGGLEDGEDATQQVFVSAHRDLLRSKKPIELRPWLFAIARNRCLDMLRSRHSADSLDAVAQDTPALEGLPEVVQRREDLRALVTDIAALPAAQREALVLFELGGLSQRKLADVLDCRPDQVKALIYQARTSLMADRVAREAECRSIREEVATGRGHELLRSHLRRHLRVCAGCREFADETRSQRAALALVLPVVPTAALKASTLTAASSGAAGAAAAPTTGGGVAGGLGGVVGKGVLVKAVAVLCAAGAAGGLGYAIVHHRAVASANAGGPHIALHQELAVTGGIRAPGHAAARHRAARLAAARKHHLRAHHRRHRHHQHLRAAAAPAAGVVHHTHHHHRRLAHHHRRVHAPAALVQGNTQAGHGQAQAGHGQTQTGHGQTQAGHGQTQAGPPAAPPTTTTPPAAPVAGQQPASDGGDGTPGGHHHHHAHPEHPPHPTPDGNPPSDQRPAPAADGPGSGNGQDRGAQRFSGGH